MIENLKNLLPNPFAVDYQYQHGPLDLYTEKEMLKFANLIVKECIGIVENLPEGYIDYRNQIEDAFRRDCVEKMKTYFGVEE